MTHNSPASHEFTSVGLGHARNKSIQSTIGDENIPGESGVTSSEISDIPRDYLDQFTVLKHLAKEVKVVIHYICSCINHKCCSTSFNARNFAYNYTGSCKLSGWKLTSICQFFSLSTRSLSECSTSATIKSNSYGITTAQSKSANQNQT